MSRLLLVAHRLPMTVHDVGGAARVVPSVGGLATALTRVHAQSSALWIGWAGDVSSMSDRDRLRHDFEQARAIPIRPPDASRLSMENRGSFGAAGPRAEASA